MSDPGLAPGRPRYAGLPRRLVAAAIDIVLAWVVLAVAVNVLEPSSLGNDATAHETAIAGLITLAVLTMWFNYFVFTEWRWGQTLGKRVVGIRVAGEGGRKVSWNRALVRNLLRIVDVIAGLLLIPLSARKQRLGDRLAHTVVLVKGDEAQTNAEPPPTSGVGDRAETPLAATLSAGGSVPPPGTPSPPEVTTGPAATWGPGRVGVGILVLLVLTLVEVGVVSIFDPELDSIGARLAAQALLAVTLVGVAVGMTSDRGRPGVPGPALGLRRPLRAPLGLAAAAYLGYVVIALVYSAFVHPHQKDITRDLGFGHGALGAVAAGILIVAAAPISEEIFFRGFIFGGFRRRLPFPVAALISAAIFGVFHYTGTGSVGVLPQLAVLGFALSWVYEETGSIYPTIAIHALNNALAFALLTS